MEKHNSHTKGTKRACPEKLVNMRMDPGQDPVHIYFALDECCQLLKDMAQTVHDEWYEDVTRQALPAEYERVRFTNYKKQGFGLNKFRPMVHTTYVNNLSGPPDSEPTADRGM